MRQFSGSAADSSSLWWAWREFLRAHARSTLAVDFFTVEGLWLQRRYVLFFIEFGSRRVHVAGCTRNPNAQWVTQQARQIATFIYQYRDTHGVGPIGAILPIAASIRASAAAGDERREVFLQEATR